MLRVEESGRRRIAILSGVLAIFLGGMMLVGLIERMAGPADANSGPFDLAAARKEMERSREIRREAAVLGSKGRWQDAVRFLDSSAPQFGAMPFLRAEAALRAGRFEEGKKGLLEFLPAEDNVAHATRLILEGKTEGYRTFVSRTIASVREKNPDATTANNSAWVAALAPDALDDYSDVIALAKVGVVGAGEEDKATFLNTLGVLLFRAERYPEAVDCLLQAEKINSDPFNWPFLAMSYRRMGKEKEASKYFNDLQGHLNKTFGSLPGPNRHELLLFYREAEAVFGPASPATARS
ncbi:MAG: hypothetical protein SFU56_03970 [Capsulimonadales bacterium]|nr:hypothetical protein [Capsulimonadales bacterium]